MAIWGLSLVLVMACWASQALAGAGANVFVCLELDQAPQDNFYVTFNASNAATKCMYSTGNPQTVLVQSSGLTCAGLGYVEAKFSSSNGDLCASEESHFLPSYFTAGLPDNKSGTVDSRWRKQWGVNTNEAALVSSVPGSMLCGSRALCNANKVTWDVGTAPDIYFIFSPDQQH